MAAYLYTPLYSACACNHISGCVIGHNWIIHVQAYLSVVHDNFLMLLMGHPFASVYFSNSVTMISAHISEFVYMENCPNFLVCQCTLQQPCMGDTDMCMDKVLCLVS